MMITQTQIEKAFGRALVALPIIAPVVWPNKTDNLPDKPYMTVQHSPTRRNSPSITAGGGQIVTGSFVVTVVTDVNQFSTEANNLADDVILRFPRATRINAGAGKMQFGPNDPTELTPQRDGVDWRQPVRIDYTVTMR